MPIATRVRAHVEIIHRELHFSAPNLSKMPLQFIRLRPPLRLPNDFRPVDGMLLRSPSTFFFALLTVILNGKRKS